MNLKTFLTHWKLRYIGDKKFEKNGGGILPCEKCSKPFQSYMHYGDWGYIYDSLCEVCQGKEDKSL